MDVDRVLGHQRLVDDHTDLGLPVIDEAKRRYRARNHAQMLHQALSTAEGDAPGAEPLGQRLQVDPAILLGHHQPHPALLVAQEQVLHMAAGELATQRLGFLHREHRRVADRPGRDAQGFEPGEQRLGRGRRAGQRLGDSGGGGFGHGRRV